MKLHHSRDTQNPLLSSIYEQNVSILTYCVENQLHHVCIRTNQNPSWIFSSMKSWIPLVPSPQFSLTPFSFRKKKKLKDRDHVLCSIHLPSPCFPIFFLHIYLLSCPLFALRMRQNLINTILRTLNITGRLLRKLHVFFPRQMKAKIWWFSSFSFFQSSFEFGNFSVGIFLKSFKKKEINLCTL